MFWVLVMSDLSEERLLELAIELARGLNSKDRFDQLLSTVREAIRCDAVVLLGLNGNELKPLAQYGLTRDGMGRRFRLKEHPRFKVICESEVTVRFPADSELPDPYDGIMVTHEGDLPIHACMGFPLRFDGELLGVLTVDSMSPGIFDDIPQKTLDIVSVMSAACLNTALLIKKLEHASQHNQQVVEELTQEALTKDGGELIGNSAGMQKLKQDINIVSPSDFNVLIEGETGVGKELVARTIHRLSNRTQGPLVYVNCAAIPENLIESELFGHIKGAFTGADKDRAGKFSLANEGTLFLDEIGELPLAAQSKILRVLQSQEIQPVGQDSVEYVNVRVLAATNRVLKDEVAAGHFRADLYHRLSVYPVSIPPLRERKDDIPVLAGYFCENLRRKLGLQHLALEAETLQYLSEHNWPGNIRELEHVISRSALIAQQKNESRITRISPSHLGYLSSGLEHSDSETSTNEEHEITKAKTSNELIGDTPIQLKQATENFQKTLILKALENNKGNWAASARQLGMDRANLNRLAKRLGVEVVKVINE